MQVRKKSETCEEQLMKDVQEHCASVNTGDQDRREAWETHDCEASRYLSKHFLEPLNGRHGPTIWVDTEFRCTGMVDQAAPDDSWATEIKGSSGRSRAQRSGWTPGRDLWSKTAGAGDRELLNLVATWLDD